MHCQGIGGEYRSTSLVDKVAFDHNGVVLIQLRVGAEWDNAVIGWSTAASLLYMKIGQGELVFSGAPLSVDKRHPAIFLKLSGATETVVVVPVVGGVPVTLGYTQVVRIVVPGAAPLVVPPRNRQWFLPLLLH